MRIGVLGSGSVGRSLGNGLVRLGHQVKMGSRNPAKGEVAEWRKEAGPNASAGSFRAAAQSGEVIFLCTSWSGTEEALRLAGPENFTGKVVVDVTNPLDFSQGPPPKMAVDSSTSGAEKIQGWLPGARVVKAFNTITAAFMTDGSIGTEKLDMFIAGDDADAKRIVMDFLSAFKWNTHDLGGLEQSRLLEYFALLWIAYGFKNNIWNHAFKLIRK